MSCVGSASSATLHGDQCQVEAAHRADVMLAHGWVSLSAVTNKHHQTDGGGSCPDTSPSPSAVSGEARLSWDVQPVMTPKVHASLGVPSHPRFPCCHAGWTGCSGLKARIKGFPPAALPPFHRGWNWEVLKAESLHQNCEMPDCRPLGADGQMCGVLTDPAVQRLICRWSTPGLLLIRHFK